MSNSPIEEMFRSSVHTIMNGAMEQCRWRGPHFRLSYDREYTCGNFRGDFRLWIDTMGLETDLWCECDSRQWHFCSSSKISYDLSRSRWLQRCGYQVFRFLGADLYRSPFKCAKESLGWLVKAHIARFLDATCNGVMVCLACSSGQIKDTWKRAHTDWGKLRKDCIGQMFADGEAPSCRGHIVFYRDGKVQKEAQEAIYDLSTLYRAIANFNMPTRIAKGQLRLGFVN